MKIRRIDPSTNSWSFGAGKQSYFDEGIAALSQNIKTRLLCVLRDSFWDIEFGVDWWNLLGGKNKAAIITQTREVLAESYGVTRINKVDVSVDADTRKLKIYYEVDTIFSRNYSSSVTV